MARVPGTFERKPVGPSRAGRLREVALPSAVAILPGRHRGFVTESGCSVFVALEPAKAAPAGIWLPPEALELWHISIAHRDRYPSWDEIADVRYDLVPDEVTMAMFLPPRAEYLNVHQHCFHLWQVEDRRAE